jgi:hypothetical protein
MEEIKGELGPLMIAGDDQDAGPRLGQFKNRPDQFVKDLSRKVVLVEEIPAVD